MSTSSPTISPAKPRLTTSAMIASIAGEGPRTVPAISGNHVFTLGATGCLRCLDLCRPYSGVVKPQAAFFELLGAAGMLISGYDPVGLAIEDRAAAVVLPDVKGKLAKKLPTETRRPFETR
mgnify:CR=1 FL=1